MKLILLGGLVFTTLILLGGCGTTEEPADITCEVEQDCIDAGECDPLMECSCVEGKCFVGMVAPPSDECVAEGEAMAISPGSPECCEGLDTVSCDGPDDSGVCEYGCVGASYCVQCGNEECGPGENKCNCPEDCDGPICGDGICELGEVTMEQFLGCSSEDDTYCNSKACDEDCVEEEETILCANAQECVDAGECGSIVGCICLEGSCAQGMV
tara:strand:- start:1809 stop:2447 length:639 start_codon:yes stop_codon:yes gene_type:complete